MNVRIEMSVSADMPLILQREAALLKVAFTAKMTNFCLFENLNNLKQKLIIISISYIIIYKIHGP